MSSQSGQSPPDADPFIGWLTRRVYQWVRQSIAAEVTAAGFTDLNPAHVAVFRNPTPDGMSPSELAEQLQITKQSVNELLGHLERHGYLVREPDPRNSRRRRIRLTDRGYEVQAVCHAAAWRAERTAADLLGEHRLADLRRNLTDLVARLDSAEQPRTPLPQTTGQPAGG
jgi:DNA-binding MarR family transcriptional regulator